MPTRQPPPMRRDIIELIPTLTELNELLHDFPVLKPSKQRPKHINIDAVIRRPKLTTFDIDPVRGSVKDQIVGFKVRLMAKQWRDDDGEIWWRWCYNGLVDLQPVKRRMPFRSLLGDQPILELEPR